MRAPARADCAASVASRPVTTRSPKATTSRRMPAEECFLDEVLAVEQHPVVRSAAAAQLPEPLDRRVLAARNAFHPGGFYAFRAY